MERNPSIGKTIIITGGDLIDGNRHDIVENGFIIVKGNRIIRVSQEKDLPEYDLRIDATGLTVLPGLFDSHVHMGFHGEEGSQHLTFRTGNSMRFSPKHRKDCIMNGVTSVKSVGDRKDWILSLRSKIADNSLAGPRVFCAGPVFTAPKGHPVSTVFKEFPFMIKDATRQVFKPEVARKEVKELIKDRVDVIKVIYGTLNNLAPRMSYKVLKSIVNEAHKNGLRVIAHTESPEEVKEAVLAGVSGVEHGIILTDRFDDELVRLLASREIYYVPTLTYYDGIHPMWLSIVQANLRRMSAGGVKIVLGTDSPVPKGRFGFSVHRELELMVNSGLTPMEAIIGATKNAADHLEIEEELGTIAEGKLADIIIVEGNPLKDIRNTRNVRVVIKNGQTLKNEINKN